MLGNADNVDIIKVPSGTLVYLGMNSSIAPFDDKNLRKTVSYAIDYDDIIKNVYNGDAKHFEDHYLLHLVFLLVKMKPIHLI